MIVKNCKQCHTQYEIYPSQVVRSNFCSKLCQGEYQKISLIGINNPNYKTGYYLDVGQKLEKRFEKLDKIIIENIKNVKSYVELSEICKNNNEIEFGGRASIRERIKELNLNIDHFSACKHRPTPNEKLFIVGEVIRRGIIKSRVIEDNLIEYKCLECGIVNEWQNELIVLELDHINGNPADNRLENLRFLCPNCHSQTETNHRGMKKK